MNPRRYEPSRVEIQFHFYCLCQLNLFWKGREVHQCTRRPIQYKNRGILYMVERNKPPGRAIDLKIFPVNLWQQLTKYRRSINRDNIWKNTSYNSVTDPWERKWYRWIKHFLNHRELHKSRWSQKAAKNYQISALGK